MSGAACCRAPVYVGIVEWLEVCQFILSFLTDLKADAKLFSSAGL